jgi:ssDNA-binding Zn-finger/Zn-ribbon topoisomerase 1
MRRRKVLDTISCPRCNALAEIRPKERRFNILVMYIVCPKCKYEKVVGLSSWPLERNKNFLQKLYLWLEKTDDELVKASIRAKIKKLEKTNLKKELGL